MIAAPLSDMRLDTAAALFSSSVIPTFPATEPSRLAKRLAREFSWQEASLGLAVDQAFFS